MQGTLKCYLLAINLLKKLEHQVVVVGRGVVSPEKHITVPITVHLLCHMGLFSLPNLEQQHLLYSCVPLLNGE